MAIINCPALTAAALTQCITDAVDGVDEIVLPAGSGNFTAQVFISNKGVTIRGAGEGLTIITDTRADSAGGLINVNDCGVKYVTITGMTIVGTTNEYNCCIGVGDWTEQNKNLRIHHNAFTIGKRGIVMYGRNDGGLIDHCTFNCSLNAACQGINISGDAHYELVPGNTSASFPAGTSWIRPLTWGDTERVYIEYCTFNFAFVNDAGVEGYEGARFCVRYCTLYNCSVGGHGLDSSINSSHSIECYGNTSIISNGIPHKIFVQMRGGSLVMFNNNQIVDWLPASYAPGWCIQYEAYRSTGDYLSTNQPYRGAHTGANGATVMTDSTPAPFTWIVNQFVIAKEPYTIYNYTDDSIAIITANTTNTVTGLLTGGADNVWDTGDAYGIANFQGGMHTGITHYDGNTAVATGTGTHTGGAAATNLADSTKTWTVNQFSTPIKHGIWNLTSGAWARIASNTANTAATRLVGGSRQTWEPGDQYAITDGYPGLEGVGWTGPVALGATKSTQVAAPCFEWNNTLNYLMTGTPETTGTGPLITYVGVGSNPEFLALGIPRPWPSDHIQENRDYFVNTVKPGYTPLGAHPLAAPEAEGPATLRRPGAGFAFGAFP